MIQLKIQREMLKKEKDEASKQRLVDLERDIEVLDREFSDLEEVWRSEKAALQGATKIKESIEQAKLDLEAAQRRQDYAKMRRDSVWCTPRVGEAASGKQVRRNSTILLWCRRK